MTPLAMREPREPDPRIEAAEDALLRFNRDDAWLLRFDDKYQERLDDLTQTPIANYQGVSVQAEVSDPTGRKGTALASLSVDATAERLRRVLAVRAAFDAMKRDDVQRKWAMALDYRYLQGLTLWRTAERVGVSDDTATRYIAAGLEVVAAMLNDGCG